MTLSLGLQAPPRMEAEAGQAPRDFTCVTSEPLDLGRVAGLVADPGAGAIATFTGVTRHTFQGRAVLRLEYEAYAPMALKKLDELCAEMRRRWDVSKVAIAHRTGVVEVAEPSVIIAVSSAHRRESLEVGGCRAWPAHAPHATCMHPAAWHRCMRPHA